MAPVLGLYTAPDYRAAIAVARSLVLNGGVGHTASYFTHESETERIALFEQQVPAGTLLHNEPSLHGAIGDIFNPETTPRLSIPSATSVGENTVTIERLLAIKTLNRRHEHMLWVRPIDSANENAKKELMHTQVRAPSAMFFSEHCLPEAVKHIRGQKALVVTDEPLVRLGYVDQLTDLLRARGMNVEVFDNVEPDPTIETAALGVQRMRAFKPDVMIAFGGGSPIDCAKVMKLMYLHPDMAFDKMRAVFMDITKRVLHFPEAAADAHALPLVAIPTTSGTGAEVTPFAVIRDGKTGRKYPLADYCMTPQTAICDPVRRLDDPSPSV
jgi:acetaldehyde dehydrogenase/alcohol dehydrogenase